jgi:hypothetical protein
VQIAPETCRANVVKKEIKNIVYIQLDLIKHVCENLVMTTVLVEKTGLPITLNFVKFLVGGFFFVAKSVEKMMITLKW